MPSLIRPKILCIVNELKLWLRLPFCESTYHHPDDGLWHWGWRVICIDEHLKEYASEIVLQKNGKVSSLILIYNICGWSPCLANFCWIHSTFLRRSNSQDSLNMVLTGHNVELHINITEDCTWTIKIRLIQCSACIVNVMLYYHFMNPLEKRFR